MQAKPLATNLGEQANKIAEAVQAGKELYIRKDRVLIVLVRS